MKKYAKAIAAAAASVVAVGFAVFTDTDPEKIPGIQEAIFGAVMTILVYFVPNEVSA